MRHAHRLRSARRRPSISFAVCLALTTFLPVAALAQTVVGTVVEDESNAPLVTAYLTLLDQEGSVVARTMSGPEGRFTLRTPLAGRFLLRSERLGRATVEFGPFDLGEGETVRIELRAAPRAISLAGIEVTAEQQCRLDPEEGVEMPRVWEQARLALQVEELTRAERAFRYHLSNYARELTPDGATVTAQRVRAGSAYMNQPYVSAPVGELLEQGWVRAHPEEGGWTFYAPDAGVLLSDQFRNAHCFRLVRDEDDPSMIGLGFEPVRRSALPGIEGALWLDRATAELSHLTFRYTSLPGGAAAGTPIPAVGRGGRVEFLQLPNGVWVVNRWHIRMPLLEEVRQPIMGRMETRVVLTGLLEEGGEVMEIRRTGGALVARLGRGSVEGVVLDGRTGAPLEGAVVRLEGTEHEVRTGPDGAFRMEALRPGNYTLRFRHPHPGRFLDSSAPLEVAVREDSPVRLDLRGPTERAIVERFCALPGAAEPREHDLADPGVVEGVVSQRESGEPVPGVAVSVEERRATLIGGWEMGRLRFDTEESRTFTGPEGWYGLCVRPVAEWSEVRFDTFRLRVRSAEGAELFAGAVLPSPFEIVTRNVVLR